MRRWPWIGSLVGGAAALALVMACTGDDPTAFTIESEKDSGTSTAPPSDGAVSSDGGTSIDDAGTQPGNDSGACGTRDTTPCGCGSAKSCCAQEDGGTVCQPRGNEDPLLGCTATNTLSCVGNCGGGQACCFHGVVTAGESCPKRATLFDSQCVSFDPGDPENACTDTTNGNRHHVMCQVNADCALYDAGTCHSALMDTIGRVVGICAP